MRSGIKNLILIDHDTIDITNLNRQIISTSKNIGSNKVDEFKNLKTKYDSLLSDYNDVVSENEELKKVFTDIESETDSD